MDGGNWVWMSFAMVFGAVVMGAIVYAAVRLRIGRLPIRGVAGEPQPPLALRERLDRHRLVSRLARDLPCRTPVQVLTARRS
jgi:hypothetical protein